MVAEVRERIAAARVRGGHGQDVTLIAVTKTYGPEAVLAAWDAGIRDVGENKVQEAEAKMAQVTVPVRWHLIGHLQRNKAIQAIIVCSIYDPHAATANLFFGFEVAILVGIFQTVRMITRIGFLICWIATGSIRCSPYRGTRLITSGSPCERQRE